MRCGAVLSLLFAVPALGVIFLTFLSAIVFWHVFFCLIDEVDARLLA